MRVFKGFCLKVPGHWGKKERKKGKRRTSFWLRKKKKNHLSDVKDEKEMHLQETGVASLPDFTTGKKVSLNFDEKNRRYLGGG